LERSRAPQFAAVGPRIAKHHQQERGLVKKRAVVVILIIGLLVGCAPAAAKKRPTATMPQNPTTIPTQTRTPILESTPTTHPASDFNLERIGQLGGSIKGITVMGDLAYVGMGPRVAAIDISQHEHPRLVNQSEPLPGLVTQLVQITSGPAPLLLVNAGRTLVLMDPSNSGELRPIRQLKLESDISALVLDEREGVVYAGGLVVQDLGYENSFSLISAVGITSEGNLNLMNSIAMPDSLLSLALAEGSLFAGVGGYDGGLYHIQLKNPGEFSAPELLIASTPERPLAPLRMRVHGKTLYLSYEGIQAYDITVPDQPERIWSGGAGWVGITEDFIFAGEQCYVFGYTILSEYKYDVVTLPRPTTDSTIGEAASSAAMHDDAFLVAYNDLGIYSAKQESLQLVGSYLPVLTNAIASVANEEVVFVLDGGKGDGRSNALLWALSLPDLEPLGQVGTETPNSWPGVHPGPEWITLEGDRLYLASQDSVWVYDVSRMPPALLGKAAIVDGEVEAIRVVMFGGRNLLAISQVVDAELPNVVTVYDLADIHRPAQVGSPFNLGQGNTQEMIWHESVLYVLLDPSYHSKSDYVYRIRVDNDTLTPGESLKVENYLEMMAVDHELLGIVGSNAQFSRAQLSLVDSATLQPLSQIALPATLPGQGRGIAITGEKALVVTGGPERASGAQLQVYNAKDPGDPRQVQTMDIPNSNLKSVSILVTGPYIIVANGAGGVEVFSDGS
jgi:hypothetical protein